MSNSSWFHYTENLEISNIFDEFQFHSSINPWLSDEESCSTRWLASLEASAFVGSDSSVHANEVIVLEDLEELGEVNMLNPVARILAMLDDPLANCSKLENQFESLCQIGMEDMDKLLLGLYSFNERSELLFLQLCLSSSIAIPGKVFLAVFTSQAIKFCKSFSMDIKKLLCEILNSNVWHLIVQYLALPLIQTCGHYLSSSMIQVLKMDLNMEHLVRLVTLATAPSFQWSEVGVVIMQHVLETLPRFGLVSSVNAAWLSPLCASVSNQAACLGSCPSFGKLTIALVKGHHTIMSTMDKRNLLDSLSSHRSILRSMVEKCFGEFLTLANNNY